MERDRRCREGWRRSSVYLVDLVYLDGWNIDALPPPGSRRNNNRMYYSSSSSLQLRRKMASGGAFLGPSVQPETFSKPNTK